MKILFIGDVVAKAGRQVLKEVLPKLKEKEKIDLCVANIENLAHGRGATKETIEEICQYGVDIMTSGNHIWYRDEILPVLEKNKKVVRPANYPPGTSGSGFTYAKVGKKKVLVINLIGRLWVGGAIDDPFRVVDSILNQQLKKEKPDLVLIDFHAEATSEKSALAWYLDGRVTAVVGTHTHVPTADESVLPKGTGYVTDIGMSGALNSVLGVEPSLVIATFMAPGPTKFEWVEELPWVFRSVVIETEKSKISEVEVTSNIKRIDMIV